MNKTELKERLSKVRDLEIELDELRTFELFEVVRDLILPEKNRHVYDFKFDEVTYFVEDGEEIVRATDDNGIILVDADGDTVGRLPFSRIDDAETFLAEQERLGIEAARAVSKRKESDAMERRRAQYLELKKEFEGNDGHI